MSILFTIYGSFQLTVALYLTYFVIALKTINKMVDIVTNRMFDVFNKFSPRESHQNDSLATMSNLKRFSSEQKNRRKLTKEAEQKARNNHIFEIKENAPPVVVPKRRPMMGLSCYGCTPSSRDSLVNQSAENFALKNILDYNPKASRYGFLQRTFKHLAQNYELKKFDYPQCAGLVLGNERVKYAVEKTAVQQYKDSNSDDSDFYAQLVTNNEKRAKRILHDMRSTLSDFLLRFTSWLLCKLLPCFVSSIVVHPGHIEMLQKAGKTNLPLIFLPLHRSHLDYILMSFILLNNNVRSPLVASGDNLRIPFFGSLLRGLGAFYIKRRIDPVMGQKDHVYKAVLHTYMNECLKAGHNIEFFLEGGRTRTGKPCMPKYGILSVIVEAFIDGIIEDALLVPVSVNYEKLVDGNFVREQLGQPKEMETFGNAIKGIWHVLNSNYGMIRVDFNQPFSLRELIKTFNSNGRTTKAPVAKMLKSNPSTTSLYGTDVVSDEHKTLVENISKHVIYDCAQSMAVMSTNAVAFLLLNRFRNGVTVDQLVDAVDELRVDLALVRRDLGFRGDSLDVINYAIELLGPGLIRKERLNNEEIIKPVAMLPNVIELMYYSNSLTTVYSLESVVATALYSLDLSRGSVYRDDLVDAAIELCDILQYEFLFCKPCQSLEIMIMDCIDDLVIRKEIFIYNNQNAEDVQKSKRIAQQFDDSSDEDYCPAVEYKLNEKATDYLIYLRSVLRSLVEAYATTAFTLEKIIGRSLIENELVGDIMSEMKKQLADGSLLYPESVSVDPIKNALKLFQKWDILECHSEKRLRLYYLKDSQDNATSINTLYNRINKFKTSSSSE
ncbi:glycerol-3-phosphate acyltransferase 1, mitochondrial isoform X2 [Onthophagus taurus]|uniref:glycerol-3-phosphate acyltransferase 1, mitochondrial isoform X2 n=1 Tax=Onthophagus taurus TaxID=166361 RepID=UPI000C20E66A|nr:glycerol-3-phosphate acyltransferase 1, mitochondrial isoform X2 [Onthophagus taurus]